jgi:multiple sugar transport system permease protein
VSPAGADTIRSRIRVVKGGATLGGAVPYLLLAPALVLFCAVFIYPLIEGVKSSTQFYQYGRVQHGVGLHNYLDVWRDGEFRSALAKTLRFVVIVVPIETALGLGLAMLCVREIPLIRLVRSTLIVPMAVMPIVVGIIFRLTYDTDVGLLAAAGDPLGLAPPEILTSGTRTFLGIVAMDVWEWTPLMFLILLAGLQSLPEEPLEAARVDGASAWRAFLDVTIPLLRPVLAVAVTLRAIDAFGTFDQVFSLTQGGPGTATELVTLYGYKTAFKFQQYGFAAAMLVMVALVTLAVALLAAHLTRRQAAPE